MIHADDTHGSVSSVFTEQQKGTRLTHKEDEILEHSIVIVKTWSQQANCKSKATSFKSEKMEIEAVKLSSWFSLSNEVSNSSPSTLVVLSKLPFSGPFPKTKVKSDVMRVSFHVLCCWSSLSNWEESEATTVLSFLDHELLSFRKTISASNVASFSGRHRFPQE